MQLCSYVNNDILPDAGASGFPSFSVLTPPSAGRRSSPIQENRGIRLKPKNKQHIPVFLKETIKHLKISPGNKYIDATLGDGGHSQKIIEKGGIVLGIDSDEGAIRRAKKRLNKEIKSGKLKIAQGNFVNLKKIAQETNFTDVNGIIFDLGLSSFQIEQSGRGFSFLHNEPLDMRMDKSLNITAADLINVLSKNQLYELFHKFGQEKRALAIAQALIRTRNLKPIKTTFDLVDVVLDVYGVKSGPANFKPDWYHHRFRIHPATKVFQALRIAVNAELENLKRALPQAARLLKQNGRLIVISFHSLEDKIVKDFGRRTAFLSGISMKILTKKPIRPTGTEVKENPRARSAKLRVFEKM